MILLALAAVALVAAPAAAAPSRTTAKGGETFRDCAECPEMVVIPPGSFIMGSTEEETTRENTDPRDAANEKPQHRVTIGYPFAVMKLEVTRGEFARFAAEVPVALAETCKTWDMAANQWGYVEDVRHWKEPGFAQTDAHPVVCVNWHNAQAFAAWMSKKTGKRYRLLSDAEWEYAVRGGTTTVRFWGDGRADACRYANVSDATKQKTLKLTKVGPDEIFPCEDGYTFTAPVGSFAPNPFGLHDMFGNAWEWVQDCFAKTYDGAPADGRAREDGDCSERVIRGGAWHADAWYVRSAKHDWAPPDLHTARVGIRLARDLE
jgi:formylglycine-generating enzyme required for sulfatase activity